MVPPCSRVKRASDATSVLVNRAGLIRVVIRATVPSPARSVMYVGNDNATRWAPTGL
jgi:hypothetical protein